uniref:Uncharacterized protein n=1 Tax=Triticum urartu TaxID=4572 RepID=A0A8R7TID1_TRIUA
MDSLCGIQEFTGSRCIDDKPTMCSVKVVRIRGLEQVLALSTTSLALDLLGAHPHWPCQRRHRCLLRGRSPSARLHAQLVASSQGGGLQACRTWGWGCQRVCLAS